MSPSVVGALAGAFVGWFIIAVLTDGPKYPGDQAYGGGPGCIVLLLVVVVGALLGAAVGGFVG